MSIKWDSESYCNSAMIKEGTYSEGETKEQVEAVVRGTFGGEFVSLGNGKFKYIAYTE